MKLLRIVFLSIILVTVVAVVVFALWAHYGFLGNRFRQEKLALCRQLLGMAIPQGPPTQPADWDYQDHHEQLTGTGGELVSDGADAAAGKARDRLDIYGPTSV
jgi:hypothetical protein